MSSILNLATYRFVALDSLPQWREQILQRALQAGMRGTVLLGREGINIFAAGPEASTRDWFRWLTDQPPFAGMTAKESWSEQIPFSRMLVRLKREIISMGVPEVIPEKQTSARVTPDQLRQWLDEGQDVTLLDVRNDYEVQVGTFERAVPIGVDSFRDFPAAVDQLPPAMRDKPLVMFCTGGIRCEKAGPLMEAKGFRQVYQLDGGILAYLQHHGSAHYRGDCFVFDKRVALNGDLQPSGLGLCYACQAVLSAEDLQSPQYVAGQQCPHCLDRPEQTMRRLLDQRHEQIRAVSQPLPGSIPHDNVRPLNVPGRCDGLTILECLQTMHPHLGTAFWQQELGEGRILSGQRPIGADRRVRMGQRLGHLYRDVVEPDVNAAIELLWEDEAMVVVNKPAPLPMHPSGQFNHNTLQSLLNRVYAPQVILRPVHRLDANTTGVVVLAKSKAFARPLMQQFAQQQVQKTYLAMCHGHPPEDDFCCTLPVSRHKSAAGCRVTDPQGDPAETRFHVLARSGEEPPQSWLKVQPLTGRTNQIRVHLWALQLPIVGDPIYRPDQPLGSRQTLAVDAPPLCLHAWKLQFQHPVTGRALLFTAPPPSWAAAVGPLVAEDSRQPAG